jgi:hypothetical protein
VTGSQPDDDIRVEVSLDDDGALEVTAPDEDPLVAEFLRTDLTGLEGMLPELQRALAAGEDLEVGGNAFDVTVHGEHVHLVNQWTDASTTVETTRFRAVLDRYEAEVRRVRGA